MKPKVEEINFADFFSEPKKSKEKQIEVQEFISPKNTTSEKSSSHKNILYIFIIILMLAGIYIELNYFYLPSPPKRTATFQQFQELHPKANQ